MPDQKNKKRENDKIMEPTSLKRGRSKKRRKRTEKALRDIEAVRINGPFRTSKYYSTAEFEKISHL